MAKKTKYLALAVDGSLLSRTTSRAYSYTVLVQQDDGSWKAWAWCSRSDLADKETARAYRFGYSVVDVVEPLAVASVR